MRDVGVIWAYAKACVIINTGDGVNLLWAACLDCGRG